MSDLVLACPWPACAVLNPPYAADCRECGRPLGVEATNDRKNRLARERRAKRKKVAA